MNKKHVFFLMFLWIATLPLAAQVRPGKFRIEDFHERKFRFIVQTAGLSPQDADKLKPVFMEHEQNTWKLHQDVRNYYTQYVKGHEDENLNYSKINEYFVNQELKQAQLLKAYFQSLSRILPQDVIFRILKAERGYKKKLIQEFSNGSPKNDPGQ